MRESVADDTAWKAIVDLYFEDKVVEAFELIQRTGAGEAGFYLSRIRMIEAEAISRRGSEVKRLASYLEIEFIPEETPGGIDPYVPVILDACAWVSRSLRFAHGPPTRLAFLSEAANAPWATSPHGYCMDMYPYEKLCLPSHLFRDAEQLLVTIAHEYAHVATLNVTQGRAPRWLEEAISMQFETEDDDETLDEFVSDAIPWLSPHDLDIAFGSPDQDEVVDAYEQSMWIGRFLRATYGDESISRLNRAMGSDSLFAGIWARVQGIGADEQGMRTTFGSGTSVVFAATLEWLKQGRPGDHGAFPR